MYGDGSAPMQSRADAHDRTGLRRTVAKKNLTRREDLATYAPYLNHHLIDITPTPLFTRLEGLHDWVARGMKMLGGMLILRTVAAPDVAADQTDA